MGFYFFMGYLSVVILMIIISVFVIVWVKEYMLMLEEIGGVVGILVFGFFLFIIGLLNVIILIDLLKIFKKLYFNESLS